MSIQPLPEDVIAQIKSSTTITSLNGVVCGLFKNSLDAGATKITVKIDYARGNCSVEDNGVGILPTEFASDGGLGKLHYTSRFPAHPSHHGSSGTFLASAAALSLMSIASHHQDCRSHNSVKIHNSKVIARHTPSPPDQRLLSFSHGTRVTVRDLFGSMPVRVKQRALTLDRATMLRDWENLKLSIVAILLAWPGQASISIRDGTGQQTAVLRNSEAINAEVAERARRSLLLSRVSGLLCQAHLFDDADPATWVALKASAAQLSIHAAVSLIPVATKRLQFISIGIQPLPNTGGQNVLYEDINRMFANSSFGVEEELGGVTEDEKVRRVADRGNKPEYTNRELKSKRGIDRHPMFYIHVELDDAASYKAGHDADEMLGGRRNHLHAIIYVLKAMIHAFLKKHQFHPSSYKPTRRRSPKRHGSLALESGSSSRDSSPGLQVRTVPWTVGLPNTQAPSDAESRDRKETSGNESRFGEGSRMISGLRPPALSKTFSHEKLTVRRLPSQSTIEDAATSPTSPALFDGGGGLLRAPFLEPEKTLDSDCFGSDDPVSAMRKANSDEINVQEEAIPSEVRESERQPNRLTKRLRGLRSGLRSPSSGARVEYQEKRYGQLK
ncbi:DNA mismatch repair protein [Pestalotiopsis sp. IQ-011]